MYKEEYEDRGFPFRDFLLKLILIVLCVFLLLWFVPKFITMNKNKCDNKCISEKQNKALSNDLDKMKRAGLTYFTEDRTPKNNGESITLSLKDMINKNIVSIKNANNVKYDLTKSYIKLSKTDNEYLMKVKLKSNKGLKQTVLHLNNYSYCDIYLCEKDNKKEEKKNDSVDSKTDTHVRNIKTKTNIIKKKTKTIKKYKSYKYKYVKYIKSKFSNWSKWSDWSVADCSTKKVTCSDDSISCLKKVQRYDKKEQIGTTTKKYSYDRTIIKYCNTFNKTVCNSGNYIFLDNKLYKTSTSYNFTLVEKNKLFNNIPTDNLYYHYQFVSKNHYNVYKYNGTITEVVSSSCDRPIIVKVPVYKYENIKDIEFVKEPVYKTTCYQSVKTRKLINKGKVLIKWSKYNDKGLLNSGWTLTKTKKRV